MHIKGAQERIISGFAEKKDWLDRYEYLVSLGKEYKGMDQKLKIEKNLMNGCQSQVWICAEKKDGRLYYKADSDSMIIKGILNMLSLVLDGQSPEDIADAEIFFIEQVGLGKNLSPSRANGVNGIVRRMKEIGREYCDSTP